LVFFPPNELLARLNGGIICCNLCRFEFLRETSWPAINARARKELTAFDIGTSDVQSVLREIGPFLSTHKRCVPCLYRVFAVTAGAKARLLYHGKSASGTESIRRAQREKKRRIEDHATEHGILLVACSGAPFRRDRGVCKRQTFNMNGNCCISTTMTVVWSKNPSDRLSCGLLMIITQEPAQSLAALDAPLSIEVPVPRK
jgi:hypothetical protein